MTHSYRSDVRADEPLSGGEGQGPLDLFPSESSIAGSFVAHASSESNGGEPLAHFASESATPPRLGVDIGDYCDDEDPLDSFAAESAVERSFVADRRHPRSDVAAESFDGHTWLRRQYGRIAASTIAMTVLLLAIGWLPNGPSRQSHVDNPDRQTPGAQHSTSATSVPREKEPEDQPTFSADDLVAARERQGQRPSIVTPGAASHGVAQRLPTPPPGSVDPPAPTAPVIADPLPQRSDLTRAASPLSWGMVSTDTAPVVEPSQLAAAAPLIGYGPIDAVPDATGRVGTPEVAALTMAVPATPAIETVISGYIEAFNALDARAATAVWPGVDQRALSRAFDSVQQQNFEVAECRIAVTDSRSVAVCEGTARYVPRVGNRSVRSERRQWTFHLRNRNEVWTIDTVEVR